MHTPQMKVTSVLDHQPLENRRTCYLLDIQQPFSPKPSTGPLNYEGTHLHQACHLQTHSGFSDNTGIQTQELMTE